MEDSPVRTTHFAIALAVSFASIAVAQAGESSSDQPSPRRAKVHARHYAGQHVAGRRVGGRGWGAIAVSLQNGGVSSGFALRRATPEDAVADAINACSGTGRPGCYAPIAAFKGCGYVSISLEGQSYSAWGTSGTRQGAIAQCQAQGVACGAPIGGCN